MTQEPINALLIVGSEGDFDRIHDLLSNTPGYLFRCDWADSLNDGLAALDGDDLDVVLLDLNLPGAKGLEAFKTLQSQYAHLPVVLLTDSGKADVSMAALREGAQDYLIKEHLDGEQLVRSIRYAIGRKRAELSVRRYRDNLEAVVEERTAELRSANEALAVEMAERQRAEEERNELHAQLYEARKLEAIGQLAGGVAHEFNNALTVILGYGELLVEQLDEGSSVLADLKEIVAAAEHATSLTHQLLAFSRKQVLRPKVVDANMMVSGAAAVVSNMLPTTVKVVTRSSPDPVIVNADCGQIHEVLRNMAMNAHDAMPDGGTISLAVENVIVGGDEPSRRVAKGRYVCLSLADTGIGMDADTARQIFDPFFTTKQAGQGIGLGMSVAHGIMRQHDGWIDVESKEGQGTVFHLYFPAVDQIKECLECELAAPTVATSSRASGDTILLVEDEQSVREFLERALIKNGYRVVTAGSVGQAREVFGNVKEDCRMVFTDLMLPDGNGLDFVTEVRSDIPDMRVLLSSGHSARESHRRMINEGGYHFLPKPYSISKLLATLQAVLQE